jgi:hypothetical protein
VRRRSRFLAHQTCCDESGQARPSRWRVGIGVRALASARWRASCAVACKLGDGEHAGNARVSNAKLGLVPKLRNRFGALPPPPPKKAPAFEGLVPDERNRFGRLSTRPSAPNLLRRVGASPTVALACVRRRSHFLAHQTCCDESGQARPSRRRARGGVHAF